MARLIAWTLVLGAFGAAACAAAEPLAVSVEIHARAVAPGEPVRIEVRSPEPLESLEGSLLGRELYLGRDGAGPEGERWSGWAMIDLDQTPGMTALELRGSSRKGRQVVGTRALTVEPKKFPEEELSVQPRYVEPPPEVRERLARERSKLAGIYQTRREVAPSSTPFLRPVPGEATSVFGTRRLFNGKPRSPHPGLDLRASTGTEVLASGAGHVVLAQELYYSGNIVIIDHGRGLFTLYAHLSRIDLTEGQEVAAGETVGLSGATGRVTGPHLHWGAKIGNRAFDPTALLDPSLFADPPPQD